LLAGGKNASDVKPNGIAMKEKKRKRERGNALLLTR